MLDEQYDAVLGEGVPGPGQRPLGAAEVMEAVREQDQVVGAAAELRGGGDVEGHPVADPRRAAAARAREIDESSASMPVQRAAGKARARAIMAAP